MPFSLPDDTAFLDELFNHIEADSIDVSRYFMDHICYRVATIREYEEMRVKMSEIATLLTEKEIGGRPISTYRLHEKLRYGDREISCVEVPSPKEGSPYPTGWEHAEFVIDEPFDTFLARYPDLEWDTRALVKPINADVSRKYEGMSVKFHLQSLEYVVENLE